MKMKSLSNVTILITLFFSTLSLSLKAQDSVLLNYDRATVSYSHTDDWLGLGSISSELDIDIDTLGLTYMKEISDSYIIGAEFTYGRFDGDVDELATYGLGIGKIFQLNENLNLIGGLEVDYLDVKYSYSTNFLFLTPSLTFDYAFSDKFGATVQVGWIEDLDAELGGVDISDFMEGDWAIQLSTTYVLHAKVGLHLGISLNTDGFSTPSIGLSYNW